jgi:MarR family 2-MHQ and catechol resistance regulon transcriptional repressor
MSLQTELELDTPFKDVYHEAVLGILRTANLLSLVGAGILRDAGITDAQFNVLLALKYKKRTLTQTELGKRLVVTRASVTSVLDKLERKRLVTRVAVANNRRIYHVELTEAGRNLVNTVEPPYREAIRAVMAEMDTGDCRNLMNHLDGMRRRLESMRDAG